MYARLENNIVAQILRVDPATIFDAAFAAQFVECADTVDVGYLWDGETFTTPPVITLTPEQIVANTTAAEAKRIASLWQAAHDYEFAQVSGSAIGLLAMGVLQGLPKCIAVQNWIKSIWSVYYTRKAGTSTDTDFSIAGQCPHSVPELMVELGF